MNNMHLDRRGLGAALLAYVLWGIFPLYWHLLKQVPSLQIIAHRMLWCALFVSGYLLLTQGTGWLRQIVANKRLLGILAICSVLISTNWGIYIWAVNAGRVIDASLGYFINPLVSVLLGVVLLKEQLTLWQWIAIGIAAFGVLWLAWQHGEIPWIALALAFSFAIYGFIRKVVAVDAVPGLAVETLILCLPALIFLLYAQNSQQAAFGHSSAFINILLVLGGPVTAIPLIGFAYGARRIPYSLVGILQYISPTLQLLCGLFILHEDFPASQAIGYACIWLALTIYAVDGWLRSRKG